MTVTYSTIIFFITIFGYSNSAATTCLDGSNPLLDENLRLFSCQRGCPHTFYCENQHCCPNTTAILASLSSPLASLSSPENHGLRNKKNIEFQLESSAEFERTMSCERFPYKLSCNNKNTTSQPLAKWYFDIQTLSCELYPFGMCEDDPLDKLALRTRQECEDRCDVAKVKEALGSFNGNDLFGENIEREAPNGLPKPVPGAQIAIDDVVHESKHIRGRPFAIEPPTDLLHVIHVKSDRSKIPTKKSIIDKPEKLVEIDENQLLTTTVDDDEVTVPTVTSDILEVLEDANDDPDVEGSGQIRITVTEKSAEKLENPEIPGVTLSETGAETGAETNEIAPEAERQQRKKSVKSMEDSFERFYQRNKESVSCLATPYRLLCSTGSPTQFVYRWEKVNGVCQSFPYGYCLHEKNVPHPRTRAECEQFCD